MMIITVAKKPSQKGTTDCALDNGCGGINIKATRIGNIGGRTHGGGYQDQFVGGKCINAVAVDYSPKGRWPGNLLLTHKDCIEECPVQAMDNQSGITNGFADTGGASRFFKVFK